MSEVKAKKALADLCAVGARPIGPDHLVLVNFGQRCVRLNSVLALGASLLMIDNPPLG
jgi:hypothetical protein